MNDWPNEETNDPLVADARNFYKVEKWTRDGVKVDSLLYGGNSLDKAREVFDSAIRHRHAAVAASYRLVLSMRRPSASATPIARAAYVYFEDEKGCRDVMHDCGLLLGVALRHF